VKRLCWLALVTDAYGGGGGIAQYNRDFLSALAEGGTTSSIMVLPRSGPDRIVTALPIRQLSPRTSRLNYALAALFAGIVRRVHVVFCGHLHLAPLAAVIARITGAKLVVQLHGIEAWECPTLPQRTAVEAADVVLCVSRYTRARVLVWASMPPERVLVLPDTVADIFAPGDGSVMRKELALDEKQVLLTVGRMDSRERYKGHDRVIAALPVLIAMGHNPFYLIVGEGDDQSRLERLARDAGIVERVWFMGALPQERLALLYRTADLFIMPSTGEGFGIAFLEAMASGTPALGLDCGGAVDPLGDGELGTLATADALTDAIYRLLAADKAGTETLSSAVRARFGRSAFAAQLRLTLERIAAAA
jgi:phosphatidyl-myo-inositol dimannoside synthase